MEHDQIPFEEAFRRLEKTVDALEAGGLTLAQATSLFEEGMKLAQLCMERLDSAELKVTRLQTAFYEQVKNSNAKDR